ncbi:hypothetical protein LR002_01845 [Candidatus Gracilibacteria bacterium]|nr:hypothetical protein [Candidatus Gracilibacteria bacterium]
MKNTLFGIGIFIIGLVIGFFLGVAKNFQINVGLDKTLGNGVNSVFENYFNAPQEIFNLFK